MTTELNRIRLLSAECETWRDPSKWLDPELYVDAYAYDDDAIKFRSILGLADQARRRRNWVAAAGHLREAYSENYGDDRRIATVQYRIARLFLQQSRTLDGDKRTECARAAVAYAGDAIRIFRKMNNQHGVIRAQALLVRTLLMAEHATAAAELAEWLDVQISGLDRADPAYPALEARVLRCRGEVRMAAGDYKAAYPLLRRAYNRHNAEGDWHTASLITARLAAAAPASSRELIDALVALNEAIEKLSLAKDFPAATKLQDERESIAADKGLLNFPASV